MPLPPDYDQQRPLSVETALDQVAEQRLADGIVLGAALPKSQRVFATVGVDPQRHHNGVLGGLDPVKEQRQQVQLERSWPRFGTRTRRTTSR